LASFSASVLLSVSSASARHPPPTPLCSHRKGRALEPVRTLGCMVRVDLNGSSLVIHDVAKGRRTGPVIWYQCQCGEHIRLVI
jgi:hypothetical protein